LLGTAPDTRAKCLANAFKNSKTSDHSAHTKFLMLDSLWSIAFPVIIYCYQSLPSDPHHSERNKHVAVFNFMRCCLSYSHEKIVDLEHKPIDDPGPLSLQVSSLIPAAIPAVCSPATSPILDSIGCCWRRTLGVTNDQMALNFRVCHKNSPFYTTVGYDHRHLLNFRKHDQHPS
jgi:hypothetical protein